MEGSQISERICSTEEREVKKSSTIRTVTKLQNVMLYNNSSMHTTETSLTEDVKLQLVESNRTGQKEKDEEGIKNEVRKESKRWNKRK
jgi:hypothetical protein